jgi:repressor LexA
MEALGPKLRRQRRRLGLTLDELAGRTGISKPYLSLIETGRVPNPPSDEKLRRLEQSLGFISGELISQAHLQRTPRDVRAMLGRLLEKNARNSTLAVALPSTVGAAAIRSAVPSAMPSTPINLDDAFLVGVLHELADQRGGNVEEVATNAVPVINRVSAGYPQDFTDLSYPPRVADDYVGCPDLNDKDAFAARVYGDSMTPKYSEGDIVIFSPAAAVQGAGEDCFVRFDDGNTTFKRVFFESGENGAAVMRLQPRNGKYRPQMVASEKVSGLYRAIFKYMRVDDD